MNKGLSKLKKINALAKKIREEKGFKVVKPKAKKVYALPQSEAISIATARLYGSKNHSSTVDGTPKKKKATGAKKKLTPWVAFVKKNGAAYHKKYGAKLAMKKMSVAFKKK